MAVLPRLKSVVRTSISGYKGLRREIYILSFARMINSVGAFVHPLMALILTKKIGFSVDEAGLFASVLLLLQAPIMMVGGKLADRFGRLKLAVVFQFCGAAAYLVCGLMVPSQGMVVMIGVASCFYALTYPAFDAMAIDLTQSGQRKEAFALLYMGMNLGFAIGPMVGGLMYQDHLQWLFIGDALTTIASTVLVCIYVKETLPARSAQPAEEKPELEREVKGSIWKVLWQRKILLVFSVVMLLFQFSYAQWAFGLPVQMGAQFGDGGAAAYGWLASFNGLLVIVFTPLIAMLIRKWRVMVGTAVGGLLYAAAFGMLIFIRALPLYYVSMIILTTGEMIMTIDAQAFIADYSPSSHRGRLNSVVNSISGTGRMLSPAVIGYVVAGCGLAAGWWTVSLTALVGGVLLVGIIRSGIFKARKVGDACEEMDADV